MDSFTLHEITGNPAGLSVMDLVCGERFYSRMLRQQGATALRRAGFQTIRWVSPRVSPEGLVRNGEPCSRTLLAESAGVSSGGFHGVHQDSNERTILRG